jgi:VWFA-related protein
VSILFLRVNMRRLVRRTLIPTLLLTCLQAFSQEPALVPSAKGVNPSAKFDAVPGQNKISVAADPCVWLPTNIPHAEAVSGVCHFAMSLPQKMPNFICNQAASRYHGKNKVPFDLVTAAVRYEDGSESYSDIKVNGQSKPEAIKQGPGLWSTGEFGSNLRSIFDRRNQALFEFAREDKWAEHAAWVFIYTIAKQNNPLWRLHGGAAMLAPPYRGELWVDQKTGELLRFGSVATNIPNDFPMTAAELQIDYANVAFADGSSFVLPADFTVTTSLRGQQATRNLVQFRSCQKFRAKTRMLLEVAGSNSAGESSVDATGSALSAETKLEDDNKVYDILREQALREDAARLEREMNQELSAATVEAFRKLNALERQRQKYLALQPASDESARPLSSGKEALTTLKVDVRMVPVSVVLRDAKGNATGSLRKEDFLLFDNGKPQTITSFSVEKVEAVAPVESSNDRYPANSEAKPAAPRAHPPVREVAYVFDDIHAAFGDLNQARVAALRHIAALRPDDRAAVFTTSGEIGTDFTADREKLQQALMKLRQHPVLRGVACPPVSEYMADLIVNHDDLEALSTATQDAINCAFAGMKDSADRAEQLAKSAAREMLSSASAANQNTLNVLQEVLRRIAALPGNRSIVLVSPGFLTLTPETRQSAMELVDRAVRTNIVVHALDVRGLYVMDVAGNVSHPANPVFRAGMDREEALAQSDVMAELAYGTGGTFFHNNNDVNEGFRRTADAPEYMYVLGFSPQKLDGKFHKLKVTLSAAGKSGPGKLTVQARQGYYALKPGSGS